MAGGGRSGVKAAFAKGDTRNDPHPESGHAVTLVLRSKDQGPGASAHKAWILGSASRPQDDGGAGLSDRVGSAPHTDPMQPAPTFNDWKALRIAVSALIAEGVLGRAQAFLRAVKEAKAAALVLLFALARSLWPEDEREERPERLIRASSRSVIFTDRDEDAWRNPPVTAFSVAPGRAARPPAVGPKDPQKLARRLTKAFAVLRSILSLCADPEAHAGRLRRQLDRRDVTLVRSEAKAFAVNAWATARRNREARQTLDRAWRGRRRARQETG